MPEPGPDDIEPVAHETLDRFATGTVTVVPFLALGVVAWQVWAALLHWSDIGVFAILYIVTGLGVTVGFHRLFTHRSFATKHWLRGVLAVCGSAAIEGPVISWVADHRKHHAFSDQPGRSAPPARRSRRRAGAVRCAAWPTPTWAGCSCTPSAARASATRRT